MNFPFSFIAFEFIDLISLSITSGSSLKMDVLDQLVLRESKFLTILHKST